MEVERCFFGSAKRYNPERVYLAREASIPVLEESKIVQRRLNYSEINVLSYFQLRVRSMCQDNHLAYMQFSFP